MLLLRIILVLVLHCSLLSRNSKAITREFDALLFFGCLMNPISPSSSSSPTYSASLAAGKLVCIETKPTADATAKCDASNVGKISVRGKKAGKFTFSYVYVCAGDAWVELAIGGIPKDALAYGRTSGKPATSCRDVLVSNPTATTGTYYVKMANNQVWPVHCDMAAKTRDGGWMLLYTQTSAKGTWSGSRHPLGTGSLGSPDLSKTYVRDWRAAIKPKNGDEFLIRRNGGQFMSLTMNADFCGFTSTSAGVCNGCHATYARGQIYKEDGSKQSCGAAGCWLNSCSVCGGCSSAGCDSIALSADHGDYAAFYGGSQWQTYGSGWYGGGTCGGGWGRARTSAVFPLNLFYRPKA